MAKLGEAVAPQVHRLVKALLEQDTALLSNIGLSKRRRSYLRRKARNAKRHQLAPADALLAALILLGEEILVEDVSGIAPKRYAIWARPIADGLTQEGPPKPVQMSLLAALDFPPAATATIQRAESKGPRRVELALEVELPIKVA